MLEGLEISVLSLEDLEEGIRIDSELYQHHFVKFSKFIRRNPVTTFSNECSVVKKGIFDIKSDVYSSSGVPFVRISNLKKMLINTDEIIFIPESENMKNMDTFLEKGDIILSKTAYPAASIVNIDFCNTSQDTVAIKLKKDSKLLSHFVVVYLNTHYGLNSMKKWFSGNIQMHLNLEDCREKIPLPIFSTEFQQKIKDIFIQSISHQETSKTLYQEAENLLLSELGIDENVFKVSKNEVVTNVKSFADFENSWRLDAEYYQPKYDLTDKAVQENAQYIRTISEIAVYNARGLQPIYDDFGTLDVINSRHILEQELDYKNFEKTNETAWETQERARVYKNDILTYTTGANIGRTQVYSSSERAFASNHVNILRIRGENPVYVAFVINSKIGRLQTEKLSAGSAQQELYPKDLNMFYIPFVKQETQNQICDNIKESQLLKTQSEQLLSLAKRAVELAIEEGEDAAQEWIVERK